MVKPTDPRGWIGVDLDGTLADYTDGWKAVDHIGDPVPVMFERVKRWLAEGRRIKIFTARVWPITGDIKTDEKSCEAMTLLSTDHENEAVREAAQSALVIQAWCQKHFGQTFIVTCVKDKTMIELYDDRCVQVVANTGELVGASSREVSA